MYFIDHKDFEFNGKEKIKVTTTNSHNCFGVCKKNKFPRVQLDDSDIKEYNDIRSLQLKFLGNDESYQRYCNYYERNFIWKIELNKIKHH